ncbi:MAG: hypothetical protein EP334_06900 [Gammaproteobacteria bacterium]|nr:MAG: hypothetical protein EP334_06900 [Gammaproteobacteria bacterium]
MSNPKSEFLQALGRFIVAYSHIQNIFQEGIYVVTEKLNGGSDAKFIRCTMHKVSFDNLENFFLTLITEYSDKCGHIDLESFFAIRKAIAKNSKILKEVRNRMMHSVWSEKFWEGQHGEHPYRMVYHKNKEYRFSLDEEDFDFQKLNEYTCDAMCLSQFIHDFLICVVDGDLHPDKCFSEYFEFDKNVARFPRERDLKRFKNLDDFL